MRDNLFDCCLINMVFHNVLQAYISLYFSKLHVSDLLDRSLIHASDPWSTA